MTLRVVQALWEDRLDYPNQYCSIVDILNRFCSRVKALVTIDKTVRPLTAQNYAADNNDDIFDEVSIMKSKQTSSTIRNYLMDMVEKPP